MTQPPIPERRPDQGLSDDDRDPITALSIASYAATLLVVAGMVLGVVLAWHFGYVAGMAATGGSLLLTGIGVLLGIRTLLTAHPPALTEQEQARG